jgi:hypothetical protein
LGLKKSKIKQCFGSKAARYSVMLAVGSLLLSCGAASLARISRSEIKGIATACAFSFVEQPKENRRRAGLRVSVCTIVIRVILLVAWTPFDSVLRARWTAIAAAE